MRPRVQIVTLAVEDLERALRFYREGLGLESPGVVGSEYLGDETAPAGAVVMFRLDDGFTLALYPRSELAKDARVPLNPGHPGGFSLGQLVGSREEVDEVLNAARAAGALVVDPARERPWGIYSGYFQDLDGHLWEIIWSPRSGSD
jgi:catechol 2,3-dioxygenase-like lactoylglutathione lyase family enzyme